MKCWFCNTEIELVLISEKETLGIDEFDVYEPFEEYDCKPCQATFIMMTTIGQVTEYNFRYKDFMVDCDVSNSCCEIKKGTMVHIELGDVMKWETIIKLDQIPHNLTPQNIEEKLSLYIVFS